MSHISVGMPFLKGQDPAQKYHKAPFAILVETYTTTVYFTDFISIRINVIYTF